MSTHPRQRSQSTSHYSTHTGFHSRKQLILTSISNSLVSGGNSSSGTDAKLDKSPKGSIDEPMLPLINLLNKHNDYVTTSSCSGRIAVYCVGNGLLNNNNNSSISNNNSQIINFINNNNNNNNENHNNLEEIKHLNISTKGGGKWLFVSHIKIEFPSENINNNVGNRKELNEFSLNTVFGKECENVILFNSNNVEEYDSLLMENQTSDNRLIYFKFEPMILHIEARTLDSAKNLVTLAINAGYRESGLLTTSKRHMVIIKSSLKLDVPIANFNSITKKISTFVDSSYLYLLILLGNKKFDENTRKINELFNMMNNQLFNDNLIINNVGGDDDEEIIKKDSNNSVNNKSWENKEERRERKRREGLVRQIGLRKCGGTISDGNDGDVSTSIN